MHIPFSRLILRLALPTFLLFLTSQPLEAIPAFARKYAKPCQTCHISEPKLNAFGELFRVNGYQLPGTIEDNPPWTTRTFQIAGMLHEMFVERTIISNMLAVPPPGLPPGGEYAVRSFATWGAISGWAGPLGGSSPISLP